MVFKKKLYTELLNLINASDLDSIQTIILENNLNPSDTILEDYLSPLLYAGKKTNLKVLKLFVTLGADINKKSCGESILILLANKKSKKALKIITYLLSIGANINEVDESLQSALYFAVFNRNLELTQLLLKHGINTETGTEDPYYGIKGVPTYTPLDHAVSSNYLEIVECLLENGANPNIAINKEPFSQNLLRVAVARKSKKLAQLLLKANASTTLEYISKDTKEALLLLVNNEIIHTSLEKEPSNFDEVKYLDLRGLNLLEFPKEIKQYRQLKALFIGRTNFKNIDFNFSDLSNLELLSFDRACLNGWTLSMFDSLIKLSILDLRGNYFKKSFIKSLKLRLSTVIVIENDAVFEYYQKEYNELEHNLSS